MASSHKDVVVRLMRDLLRQVQSLDEQEFEDVLAGNATLQLRIESTKRPSRSPKGRVDELELREAAVKLRSFATREEGEKLINEKLPLKEDLVRLAKVLDLPVQRDDTVDHLRSKLIESTIGFRLRSAAIQGTTPLSKVAKEQSGTPQAADSATHITPSSD